MFGFCGHNGAGVGGRFIELQINNQVIYFFEGANYFGHQLQFFKKVILLRYFFKIDITP